MPFTVSAATAATRLNGQFATAAIATNEVGAGSTTSQMVVNLFEWELTINTETEDATAHGDFWMQPVILKNSWTARARAYFTTAQAAGYQSIWRLQSGSTGGAYKDPPGMLFTGYADSAASIIIFQGNCFVTRGNISVPMAMVEQELEFQGVGSPAVIG